MIAIDPGPTGCHFYVTKKRRYCRLFPSKGHRYCGEHLQSDTNERIVCPLDPSHTCFKNRLKGHLKRCNVIKNIPSAPWFQENINSCSASDASIGSKSIQEESNTDFTKYSLKDFSIEDVKKVIKIVDQLILPEIPTVEKEYHPALLPRLKELQGNDSALKHLKQQASLLNVMSKHGLLIPNGCFCEFGAGRGQMTECLIEAIGEKTNTKYILIDRGTNRRKLDSKYRKNGIVNLTRLRVDIRDLNLGQIENISSQDSSVVSVSKHLCGCATDLTLTCLNRTVKNEDIRGGVIALCCHHRCTWMDYCAKDFMIQNEIHQKEFCILVKLTSWGVCKFLQKEYPDENIVNDLGIDDTKKENIGIKCKRIIDLGRVKFLNNMNLNASLCEYTTKELSLENLALVFYKTQHLKTSLTY